MGRTENRFWRGSIDSGLARREQRSCNYQTYLPDLLDTRAILLEADVAADISDAEASVHRFTSSSTALTDTEALARLLLRSEAVASSKLEGIVMAGGRLLRAEAALDEGERTDATAREILGNIRAMRTAVHAAEHEERVTIDTILRIHRELLRDTDRAHLAGVLRTEQNWIGGNDYNPCAAAYVPPPPEMVPELLENLCEFINGADLPPIAQAAIAHAQFETIHPFGDGNGRTGRALIHVVLRRRRLVTNTIVPISLVLATWVDRYINGLVRFRFEGTPDSPAAREATNQWVATFAAATRRAIEDARAYEARVREIESDWRGHLGSLRANSAALLLLHSLPGSPVITVNTAAALINRSFPATNKAIARLVDAGVLRAVRLGRRNRAFEATRLVDAFTELERRLASVSGDTAITGPVRGAPALRRE